MKIGINAAYRGPLPPDQIDQIAALVVSVIRAAVQTVEEAQAILACCAGKVHVLLLIEQPNEPLLRSLLPILPMTGDVAMHLGNEVNMGWPEPSPHNCAPDVFEDWIHVAQKVLRREGFAGDIYAGSVCDLRQWSLDYLTAARVQGWPRDVIVTFSRYSANPWTQDPIAPQIGTHRAEEGVRLRQCIGPERAIACSEFGAHYAIQTRRRWWGTRDETQLLEGVGADHDDTDLQYLDAMGCVLACKYQWPDGDNPYQPEHRRGVRREDGSLRPTADVLTKWARKGDV